MFVNYSDPFVWQQYIARRGCGARAAIAPPRAEHYEQLSGAELKAFLDRHIADEHVRLAAAGFAANLGHLLELEAAHATSR